MSDTRVYEFVPARIETYLKCDFIKVICFSNDTRSEPFILQRDGINELNKAFEDRFVSPQEATAIRNQIIRELPSSLDAQKRFEMIKRVRELHSLKHKTAERCVQIIKATM